MEVRRSQCTSGRGSIRAAVSARVRARETLSCVPSMGRCQRLTAVNSMSLREGSNVPQGRPVSVMRHEV